MDDDELLRQFESGTFPLEDWHHREHIRIAYMYLQKYGFGEALIRLREGIQRFNALKGIVDGPGRGYHETMTQAWLRLVDFTMKQHGAADSADAFAENNPQLLEQRSMRFFYSRERFMSAEAKARFVEPDLAPLPRAVYR